MSDSIQTVVFNKTHRLTAKPLVSLEMPVAVQQFQLNEGMPVVALEADFLRAEALLADMREIRGCLEQSLDRLIPKD